METDAKKGSMHMFPVKIYAFADEASSKLDGQILALKRNGLAGLEIRGVDGTNVSAISIEKAKEVRRKLDDNGLTVWSVGSPIGKIKIQDDFDAHLDTYRYTLEIADILGAKNLRLFSFYIPKEDAPAAYHQLVIDRMGVFLDIARDTGVTLCHENEKGIYSDMAVRCAEIHREFPQLKAVFDPANFIQCGQDTVKAWEMLSPYVEYMHIKDAMADGSVVPAGKGIGNLPYLLSQYKGEVLTLEPHLSVFDGFDKLEADEKTKMGYCYPSSRAAFDAAVNALKELI